MLEQEFDGDLWTLYRHKNDNRVEYWACECYLLDLEAEGDEHLMEIRATQNALHPEWDEMPLEYTVDGGTMPYDAFMSLYERVEV